MWLLSPKTNLNIALGRVIYNDTGADSLSAPCTSAVRRQGREGKQRIQQRRRPLGTAGEVFRTEETELKRDIFRKLVLFCGGVRLASRALLGAPFAARAVVTRAAPTAPATPPLGMHRLALLRDALRARTTHLA